MEAPPSDDSLLALLDTYTAVGSDIENRVMAQVEHEESQAALQTEVAALRVDVAAMRAEIAELKQILLSGRETQPPPAPPVMDSRGKSLLPYARPDSPLSILS